MFKTMNKIMKVNPILIRGAERSGSSMIAKIMDMCDVFSGNCNNMYESKKTNTLYRYYSDGTLFPDTSLIDIPVGWGDRIIEILKGEGWKGQDWMMKGSKIAQYWPIWHYSFPDAKWLIVRRRTGDVVQSCMKTGYMRQFKNPDVLRMKGFELEEEGWIWWVHQYEKKFIELIQVGANARIIWPERMVDGDFSQIKETIEWLGLNWNNKIPEVITPLLEKSRRNK